MNEVEKLLAASKQEERLSRAVRHSRRAEPRIFDAATHPRRWVSLIVAAEFLEVDRKTLGIYLADRRLEFQWFGRRRKIAVAELVAFLERQKVERKAG